MRVLVADDSITMRRILTHMLSEMGITDVLTADGGDVVMELLGQHDDVDLVLMDWNMPCINGIDCLRQIRANPPTANLSVVMVSSEALRERIVEAIQAGATGYLIKPFEQERFAEVVGKIIAGGGARMEMPEA